MGNYIDEFRDSAKAKALTAVLAEYKGRKLNIMEVCGTHTMALFRSGIRSMLPENIRLVSGPGCPVCVTPASYMDAAVNLSRNQDVIITTFGDMMRVPGSESSLLREKALGRNVRVVYSPLDSLSIAKENPDKKVVLLSIGFETTTPVIALTVLKAGEEKLPNFFVLAANKTMPEALEALASDKDINIDGYLYPGHVSAIIGTSLYETIAEKYGIPGVVAGFEPLDLLHSLITLVRNLQNGKNSVENMYSRVVKNEGNPIAVEKMYEVFEKCDSEWRGIGCIPGSGLKIRDKYGKFDAWKVFDIRQGEVKEPSGCLCGQVLRGIKTPRDCKLFNTACTPENPVGACMVSSEGTCSAYYKYGGQ